MNRAVLTIALVCGAVVLVGLQGLAQAETICQHLGDTDPTTEGFTQYRSGSTYQAANVEFGVKNWTIYSYPGDNEIDFAINPTQAAAMTANGWTLTVQAYDWWSAADNATDNGVDFDVVTASKIYRVALGCDASGNQLPYVLTSGGPLAAVGSPLSNYWHTYTISAGPNATSASLSIDGSPVTMLDGLPGTWTPAVEIGSISSGGFGYGEWAQVTLVTNAVPEPSSIVLLVSTVLGLAAYAWRKRK